MKFETKKQILNDNEVYKSLMEYEGKLCANQSNIIGMKQYIEYKQKETDYKEQLEIVNQLTNNINEMLLRKVQLED